MNDDGVIEIGSALPQEEIDLTRSIPPFPQSFPDHLSATLARLATDKLVALSLRNGIAGGTERDRGAGAKWLSSRFRETLAAERVVVTNGTQGALLLVLEQCVGKGGLLLAEQLSYAVLARLAERAHIRIKGLSLDGQGIVPEAFEAACRTERPRALYCNPTIHNPTTAIMSEARRLKIADIARRYGVMIIEDDPLGRLHPDAPRPIAALAPDVVWYVMGLTKCLAHGLRVAYLVGPSAKEVQTFVEPVRRLSHWFPAPLSTAIVTEWIENGTAETICGDIRVESSARQALAVEILQGAEIASPAGAMHLWLKLPDAVPRQELVRSLAQRRVIVRPSDGFAVDDQPCPNALRMSLSSPMNRDSVATGLKTVAEELSRRHGRL